jgi:hypothetical protein
MVQSKVDSPLGIKGVPFEWISIGHQEEYIKAKFSVTIERAASETCSATWNLGSNSTFTLTKKNHGNPDQVGQSQDLPDANWLLASSPALNKRTLTLVSICAVFFLWKYLQVAFTNILSVYNLDKHQTMYNTHGRNECVYAQLCLQLYIYLLKPKSHYNWWPVSQYVKVSSPLLDLWPDITFWPKFVFWKLLSCPSGAPSLTRGQACHLSFSVCSNLPAFTSSIYVTCVEYLPVPYALPANQTQPNGDQHCYAPRWLASRQISRRLALQVKLLFGRFPQTCLSHCVYFVLEFGNSFGCYNLCYLFHFHFPFRLLCGLSMFLIHF